MGCIPDIVMLVHTYAFNIIMPYHIVYFQQRMTNTPQFHVTGAFNVFLGIQIRIAIFCCMLAHRWVESLLIRALLIQQAF
ncbi:hypothetical protein BD289DRAFT_20236 [Coniella lustricola]|uniref:Uncharacterized protein n=1 Tax=Coniella lustricola TaxID=2025994 RepID=A0A2T3AJM4_9PEZI|nr:hypothetical protein BD289DRAFT_20236 [Coniella lustricola]